MSRARPAASAARVGPAVCLGACVWLGCAPAIVRQPPARGSPEEAFGSQAHITTKQTRDRHGIRHKKPDVWGELVGCDRESVFVLLNAVGPEAYVRVAWREVRDITLVGGNAEEAAVFVPWAVLGAGLGVAHGYWAIYTGPAWVLVSVPSTVIASVRDSLPEQCSELRAWARFPQGVPKQYKARF
ncbi:MAG: hypothetical protein HY744_27335 [Deltaproteobacteria bacterium]|nr:hypothetical protein [Deltaproteobacteria bacterium]